MKSFSDCSINFLLYLLCDLPFEEIVCEKKNVGETIPKKQWYVQKVVLRMFISCNFKNFH